MNISMQAKALADDLSLAAKIAGGKKDVIPVLRYVLLTASGDELSLTATDGDISCRSVVKADVKEEGAVLLHARRFADLARLIAPDNIITIATNKKGDVSVTSGAYGGRMQSLPVEEFPVVPPVPVDLLPLPSKEMADLIAKVEFAIADHDPRYQTNGAYMHLSEGRCVFVGTDGYRLNVAHAAVETPTEAGVILPKRALPELRNLFDGIESGWFGQTENHLFFVAGDRAIMTRVVMGKYPAYERMLSRVNAKVTVETDREALLAAIRRVTLMSDEFSSRDVSLHMGHDDAFVVRAYGVDVGEAEEPVTASVTITENPLDVSVQGTLLVQILSAANGPRVRLEFGTADDPLRFIQLDNALVTFVGIIAVKSR